MRNYSVRQFRQEHTDSGGKRSPNSVIDGAETLPVYSDSLLSNREPDDAMHNIRCFLWLSDIKTWVLRKEYPDTNITMLSTVNGFIQVARLATLFQRGCANLAT